MEFGIVSYFKRFLDEYPLVYLNIPSGSGKSYILSSLYSSLREISLFTRYPSHRTPAGEFFLTKIPPECPDFNCGMNGGLFYSSGCAII